ncbi:hypothetical protein C8Q77DRAFT_1215680 [Trametes polyzona]|nr:hypothetical protein C8Q77DRAFT_1215680 [Trametes polyzona]
MHAFTAVIALAASALGQSIAILSPPAGATLSPGSTFIVDVDKADSLSPSQDVSVAIGLESCTQASCDTLASSGILGNIVFTGDYSPQLRPNSTHVFQNYSVQVPSTLQAGPAVLSIAHFYLLGVGASPAVEMVNTTVTIQ